MPYLITDTEMREFRQTRRDLAAKAEDAERTCDYADYDDAKAWAGESTAEVLSNAERALTAYVIAVSDREDQDRSLVVSAPDRPSALRLWASYAWEDVVGDIEPSIADGFIPELVAGWSGQVIEVLPSSVQGVYDPSDSARDLDQHDIASAFLGAGLELLAHN